MRRHLELPATTLDDLLLRLHEQTPNVFALNSASSDGWGRLLAWNPVAMFHYEQHSPQETAEKLEEFIQKQQAQGRRLIGYISYDFGCLMHGLNLKTGDDLKLPLIVVASFDDWIIFSKSEAQICTSSATFTQEVQELMARPVGVLPEKVYAKPLQPTQSHDWYGHAYQQVATYLKAGDVYQVNLTHRLEGTTTLSGKDLFSRLSRANTTNFQAYIAGNDFEIMSLSPERFIRINGPHIETSPIKGTRPRGISKAKDSAQRTDLLTNPKDRAELNMITDLMRNDLGAICQIGSVHVTDKRHITAYPTLWHAQSTIKGLLRPDISPIAALMSVMPGGSITGCPKKRAMEIIDELEVHRRGIYTGTIFTIDPETGELDSSIAIRTMIKKADHVYLSVGGGIVSDSKEQDEYEESLHKAASFTDIL